MNFPLDIPESELMAEKLGMVVLCQWCGKRIECQQWLRIPIWHHVHNNDRWCIDPSLPDTHPLGRTWAEPRNQGLKVM